MNQGSANAVESFSGGRMTNLEKEEKLWSKFVFANVDVILLDEMEPDVKASHVRAISDKKYSGTAYDAEGNVVAYQGTVAPAGQPVVSRVYSMEELEGFGMDFLKKKLIPYGIDTAGMNKATLVKALAEAQAQGAPAEPTAPEPGPATPGPERAEEAGLPNVPPPPGN